MSENVIFDQGGITTRGDSRRLGFVMRTFMKLTGIESESTANTGMVILAIVVFVLAIWVWIS